MIAQLSVVICTYKRYDHLKKAIDSLLIQNFSPDLFEIIVVDNTPDCPERSKAVESYVNHPRVKYFTVDRPGLANARNVGAEIARAPLLAFIDDDAIASANWVEEVINGFEKFGDRAKVAGGRIIPNFEIKKPEWLDDRLLVWFTVIDWGDEAKILGETQWVAGANIAYRRDAYLSSGGCNPALGRIGAGTSLMSNEEIELTKRIHDDGGLTVYIPNAEVKHFVPAERMTRSWLRQRVIWQAISDRLVTNPTNIYLPCLRYIDQLTHFFTTLKSRKCFFGSVSRCMIFILLPPLRANCLEMRREFKLSGSRTNADVSGGSW